MRLSKDRWYQIHETSDLLAEDQIKDTGNGRETCCREYRNQRDSMIDRDRWASVRIAGLPAIRIN